MKTHELKTDPEVFEAIVTGHKTFELRKNDRDFQVGDLLNLRETQFTGTEMKPRHNGGYPGKMIEGKPLVYTGRQAVAEVTHTLQGPIYGLVEGWAILSIKLLPTVATSPTYAQGQEDMRERAAVAAWSKGMELNGRVFDPRQVGSECAKSIRALPIKEGSK